MLVVAKHETNTRVAQGDRYSFLLLACNTAKSLSKLIEKCGSSLLVPSLTFTVKTFTVETQSRQILAAMLNSTCHVIYKHGPDYLENYPIVA